MNRVLHAPPNLEYQLALLRSELREIFAKAPPIPSADAATESSNRKPLEGDCPICCMEFKPEEEKIVYCKAACGNNIHEVCFSQWKASKNGGTVTCPFCRMPWQGEDVSVQTVAEKGEVNYEGYVNVAEQLGLSGVRGMYLTASLFYHCACCGLMASFDILTVYRLLNLSSILGPP